MPDLLSCRMYGHHWDSKEVSWDASHYWDKLECEVCGSTRVDKIRRRTGRTEVRKYKYQEDYLVPKGEVKKTRAEIKKEYLDDTADQD